MTRYSNIVKCLQVSETTDGPEEIILDADEYLNPRDDYDEYPSEGDNLLEEEPSTPGSTASFHSQHSCATNSMRYPSQQSCNGYPSNHQLPFQPLTVDTHIPNHPAPPPGSQRRLIREPKYAHLEARSHSMQRQRSSDGSMRGRYTSDPCHDEDPLLVGGKYMYIKRNGLENSSNYRNVDILTLTWYCNSRQRSEILNRACLHMPCHVTQLSLHLRLTL